MVAFALKIELDPEVKFPSLRFSGTGIRPNSIELRSSSFSLVGRVEKGPPASKQSSKSGSEDSWSTVVPLITSRWGGPELPPPSGRYRVLLNGAIVSGSGVSLPEARLVEGRFRIAFEADQSEAVVVLAAPLQDDELGSKNQSRLEANYKKQPAKPTNSVFFESFYGQNASCNPRAIDRELARVRPDITRYWGVADASVLVPEGSIPLIEGSASWWEVRANSKLIVINDWLRNRYKARKSQKVLQTWHGTMLKRLALSRRPINLRLVLASLRERRRWDILLAQNEHAKRVFRRAYAYFRSIWVEGYPRNDILFSGDASGIRKALQIPPSSKVLLYAPTWRDDRPGHVDHLNVAELRKRLGAEWVVLVRGHSKSIELGKNVLADGVIDVTRYPDVSDLFLVADLLVTDYSSVMFDFTVTGKPILFFTPDFEHYRQKLRGFYFDLLPIAPGPVVTTSEELFEAVINAEQDRDRYREKYAEWRERFNSRDDGHSASRVVARLIDEKIL